MYDNQLQELERILRKNSNAPVIVVWCKRYGFQILNCGVDLLKSFRWGKAAIFYCTWRLAVHFSSLIETNDVSVIYK